MTFLFIDGCDIYGNRTELRRRWRGGRNSTAIAPHLTVGRFGGAAIHIEDDDLPTSQGWYPQARRQNLFVSFYQRNAMFATDRLIHFKEGPIIHYSMRSIVDTGQIHCYTGDLAVLQGTSPIGLFQCDEWDLIEIYISVSDAVSEGRVEVRVNEATVIEFDGDTRAAGFGQGLDSIEIMGDQARRYFDDILVYDDLGADNNDWIGDYRIQTLFVDGFGEEAWDNPIDTDENYKQVDDKPFSDELTSYVQSQTAGAKDLYSVEDISLDAEAADNVRDIRAVQVTHTAARTNAGTRDLIQIVESNGSEDRSDAVGPRPVHTDWGIHSHIVERNPDGNVLWTEAAVAAMTIGQEAGV